jgi:cell division protein FtsW (lipid II flippase)
MTPAPSPSVVSLDYARVRLAVLWFGLGAAILIIVVLQSLLQKFGSDTQSAWAWLLPTLMPTLTMILTVLGYTALSPDFSSSVVRKSFYLIALFLSALYLILISMTILIAPFVPSVSPIQLMHTSNLWLGPFQGLVASALGVLFVSKQKGVESQPGQPDAAQHPAEPPPVNNNPPPRD